jgi:serine/threonine protein kinase
MWQAGCCLYSLLSGFFPFHPDYPKRIVRAQYFEMVGVGWDPISDSVKDLIRRILVPNPRERLSAQEILAHEWLSGKASTTDLGAEYFDRIKQLALRQKLKRFFAENDITARNKERRESLQKILPFLKSSKKEDSQAFHQKMSNFRGAMIESLNTSSSDALDDEATPTTTLTVPAGVIDFETFVRVLNDAGLPELALESVFNIFDLGNTGTFATELS